MKYREFFDWGYIVKASGDKILIHGRNVKKLFDPDIGIVLSGRGSIFSNVFEKISESNGDLFLDKIGYRAFYKESIMSKILLRQIEVSMSRKKYSIAIEILRSAAKNKLKLLNLLNISDEVKRNAVNKILDLLNCLKGEVLSQLMSIEAVITRNYLEAVATIIPSKYGFKARTRRPPRDFFSAALSYGNMILYRVINRFVLKHGLDPRIGFLHKSSRYRYSLTLDISEIFKQVVVDSSIIPLYTTMGMDLNRDFRRDGEAIYLSKSGDRKVSRAINHKLNLKYEGKRIIDWIEDQVVMFKKYLLGLEEFKPFIFE